MGKELLCQIAVLEQQAGGINEELSNLRAQCLREAADAAFAEYSCTVVEQLEAFSNQIIKESCGPGDGPGDGLFNGVVRKSRLHRVLMRYNQLDYALREAVGDEELDHTADLSEMRIVFTAGEGGAADVGDVITAWSLIKGVATRPFKAQHGDQLCISMFELPSDFHLGVHRVALRPPPGQDRADAARVLVKAWHNMLRAEKVRQLHGLRKGDLLIPNLPASWGPWDTLEAMPCVVWLQVEAKQPAAKCMPRKQAPLVRRRVGHASLDWHGTITNSYNRIPWANREAIDHLVFASIRDGDDYSLLSFAGWSREAKTRHQIEADRQLSLYFSSKEYENMKFTRNRIGPGGKADYIVSQLREDVDWVHFDDRKPIVDEINTLRHPNLRAVLITNAYTLANGIQDLLQDRQRQQRFLDAANAAVVAEATPPLLKRRFRYYASAVRRRRLAPTSKRRRRY